MIFNSAAGFGDTFSKGSGLTYNISLFFSLFSAYPLPGRKVNVLDGSSPTSVVLLLHHFFV